LYIVLSAGTKVLPPRFRITEYKAWMCSVLVLWGLVLLLTDNIRPLIYPASIGGIIRNM